MLKRVFNTYYDEVLELSDGDDDDDEPEEGFIASTASEMKTTSMDQVKSSDQKSQLPFELNSPGRDDDEESESLSEDDGSFEKDDDTSSSMRSKLRDSESASFAQETHSAISSEEGMEYSQVNRHSRLQDRTSGTGEEDGILAEALKSLFENISQYTPFDFELEPQLKLFLPDFIPATGDIDPFLKVIPGKILC
ncbi:hypothetical protein HK102_013238 [Quaeritorhiza haematococci]|nr:hypothetical protein HK102_013238 [Quaeritorhiza haematococci]